MNMNKCNEVYCHYRNERGYCDITACVRPVDYRNVNFTADIIIFPQTIGNRTFYSRKELEDYILMTQNEDYGRGNLC